MTPVSRKQRHIFNCVPQYHWDYSRVHFSRCSSRACLVVFRSSAFFLVKCGFTNLKGPLKKFACSFFLQASHNFSACLKDVSHLLMFLWRALIPSFSCSETFLHCFFNCLLCCTRCCTSVIGAFCFLSIRPQFSAPLL